MTNAESTAEIDTLCSILAHRHRRHLLRCLAEGPAEMRTEELAERIAQKLDRAESPERILTSLRHAHLPKVADFGAIDYDESEDVVVATDVADRLLACLDSIEGQVARRA